MRKIELKISKLTLPSKNWPDFPMQDYNPSAIFATTPAVVLRELVLLHKPRPGPRRRVLQREQNEYLSCKYPQEHHDGINRRIAQGRHIVACRAIGISQCRRIGHTTGHKSHERIIIHLQPGAGENTDQQQRDPIQR